MTSRLLGMAFLLSILMGCSGESWAESFFDKVLRISGISATTGNQRPSGSVNDGDVWIISLSGKEKRVLTNGGSYRSPVFNIGDKEVFALQGEGIVKIPTSGGRVHPLYSVKGIKKLVGVDRTDSTRLLFLAEDDDGRTVVGLISMVGGGISYVPYDSRSRDDRNLISSLKEWRRTVGDKTIYVETETKTGMVGHMEWTDVILKEAGASPQNLSQCDGVSCGQPSISIDGTFVVFIKQAK